MTGVSAYPRGSIMPGESPAPRLNYAKPQGAGEFEVHQAAGEIRFDLGPEPRSLFLARIIPWALAGGIAIAAIVASHSPVQTRMWQFVCAVGYLFLPMFDY